MKRGVTKRDLVSLLKGDKTIPFEAEITKVEIHRNGYINIEADVNTGTGLTQKQYKITSISHNFTDNERNNG